MKTGEKIKEVRESKDISQYGLAKAVKCLNQSQICKIENCTRKVTAEELNSISIALKVTMQELIGDESQVS